MNQIKQREEKKNIATSFRKAFKSFWSMSPVLLGVILVLGLFRTVVSNQMISTVLTGELLRDTTIGALIGSISAGNPVTSYVIGGELLKENVSLIAVTAFVVAWVTVGIVQLPAEVNTLGRRFACVRNILCFFLSLLVSVATVKTLMVIQ